MHAKLSDLCARCSRAALTAAVVVASASTPAQAAPRVAWVYGWGTDLGGEGFGNTEHIRAIDSDPDGNVYAIGPSGGAQAVKVYGPSGIVATLPNLGGSDIVIAKVGRGGELVWARAYGGATDDGAYDLSIDHAGALLITGRTTGTLTLGPSTIGRGGFVAKLTADGVPLWAVPTDGVPNEQTSDASGNVYTATPEGLTKLTADGKPIWRQPLEGGGRLSGASVRGVAVAGDGSGDALVAGQFSGSVSLGGITITSKGGMDAFVGRLRASDGAATFLKAVGGAGTDYGRGVSATKNGFYFAGAFNGTADFFGQASVTSAGGQDVFLARLDEAGGVLWTTQVGGRGDEEGAEVSTGRGGMAVIGGSFSGALTVGASNLQSRGATDFLVAAFDERKTPLWAAAPLGGPGRDLVYASGADERGGATFAGGYDGAAQFGAFALTSVGGLDGVFGLVVDDGAPAPDAGASVGAADAGGATSVGAPGSAAPRPDAGPAAPDAAAGPAKTAQGGGCAMATRPAPGGAGWLVVVCAAGVASVAARAGRRRGRRS